MTWNPWGLFLMGIGIGMMVVFAAHLVYLVKRSATGGPQAEEKRRGYNEGYDEGYQEGHEEGHRAGKYMED